MREITRLVSQNVQYPLINLESILPFPKIRLVPPHPFAFFFLFSRSNVLNLERVPNTESSLTLKSTWNFK